MKQKRGDNAFIQPGIKLNLPITGLDSSIMSLIINPFYFKCKNLLCEMIYSTGVGYILEDLIGSLRANDTGGGLE